MNTAAQQLQRSFRSYYVPAGVDPDCAEVKSLQGTLPSLALAAPNNDSASLLAHKLTGRPIHVTVREEPPRTALQCRVFRREGAGAQNFEEFIAANVATPGLAAWAKAARVGEQFPGFLPCERLA